MASSVNSANPATKKRVDELLEVIIAFAQLDFSKKTTVLGNDDVLDAIGAGVNMLGEELQASTVSLKEKEQLLKEIHHRVKNNLQIVSSLLSLQSENIVDENFLDLIKISKNRIASMALVHEMLYKSPDLSKIQISDYIHQLGSNISDSFSMPGSRIIIDYRIEKEIYFDVDLMIPLGLIINEILSNSFKYAFPKNTGIITIELKRQMGQFTLHLGDNGVGFTIHAEGNNNTNLGIQLIHMLIEQIDGSIKNENKNGTSYLITFKQK